MNRFSKYLPIFLLIAFIIFVFRFPFIFGRSFCIYDISIHTPWSKTQKNEYTTFNSSTHDQVFAHYPRKMFIKSIFQKGWGQQRWTPLLMGGYPIGADPHMGYYDPFNFLFVFFPLETAFKILSFFQLFLSGIFAYLFLRELGVNSSSALFSCFAFISQPFYITHLAMPTNVQSAMWFPYLLWIFEKMLKKPNFLLHVPLLAIGIALSFFGGFPPIFILVVGGWLIYCLLRIIFISKCRAISMRKKHLLVIFWALIMGIMLSAPQLFPTWSASKFSQRRTLEYNEFKSFALPVDFLVTLVNPYLLGEPVEEAWSGFARRIKHTDESVSRTNYLEDVHYVGLVVLLLALWGAFFVKSTPAFIMVLVSVCSLLVLYGAPIFLRLYYLIPGVASSRPDRIIFLWGSCTAFLAGIGMNDILEGKQRRKKREIIFGLLAVLLSIVLFFTVSTVKLFANQISGGIYLSAKEIGRISAWKYLFLFVSDHQKEWSYNNFVFALLAFLAGVILLGAVKRKKVVLLLFLPLLVDADIAVNKFFTFQNSCFPSHIPEGVQYLQTHCKNGKIARFGSEDVFPSNSPFIYDISDSQGRQALLLKHRGLYMNAIEEGIYQRAKRIGAFKNLTSLVSSLIDADGIKCLISDKPISWDNENLDEGVKEVIDNKYKLVYQGELFIYENNDVYPPAWVVPNAIFVYDENHASEEIKKVGLNPGRTVILEGEKIDWNGDGGEATVRRISSEEVVVETGGKSSGWLVLSETWYPYWRAEVDGRVRKIWKADVAFMAVPITKGEKRVVFKFDDRAYKNGLLTSIPAALVAVCLLTIGWMKSKKCVVSR